jgi:hypothetical protein
VKSAAKNKNSFHPDEGTEAVVSFRGTTLLGTPK